VLKFLASQTTDRNKGEDRKSGIETFVLPLLKKKQSREEKPAAGGKQTRVPW
jgi:hypothetical protein